MAEPKPAGDGKPRRRQSRGERRIAQLLEAAASVFCSSGYTGASTNAIAREAGVSPGTLYQFFPNKEAIAVELGDRLIHRMREAHGLVFTEANAALPLREMLDAILDPLIGFNLENPAFLTLINGPEVPGRLADDHDALHDSLQRQVEDLISFRAPGLPKEQCVHIASMAFAIFKGGLTLIASHEGAEQAAYVDELKAALYHYLAPTLGADAVPAAAAATGRPS